MVLFVYLLCAFSGVLIERRCALNSLYKKTMLVFAVGAVQFMAAAQILSLAKALTGMNLFLANLVMTALVLGLFRKNSGRQVSWKNLFAQRRAEALACLKDFTSLTLCSVAGLFLLLAMFVGWMLFPYNDSYHFEMPLFWIQNGTILPFPVNNPRIITLSFLAEALQLPGYFLKLEKTPIVASSVMGPLALWTIFSLARRMGASLAASASAAAVSVGYCSFAFNMQNSGVEMFLSGIYFGAAVVFLMDLHSNQKSNAPLEAGCSVLLFLLACGTKNSSLLLAPFYFLFLAIAMKRRIGRELDGRKFVTPVAAAIVLSGIVGALFSGAAWNNLSNKLYFGKQGLPPLIKGTIPSDFGPRAVWTRVWRGVALTVYDTFWVPKSALPFYENLHRVTLKTAGAKLSLSEDDGIYYTYEAAPRRGLGPLGIALFIPGVAFGLWLVAAEKRRRKGPLSSGVFNMLVLVSLTAAAFFMCHAVFRWQSIGMIRLMFPFVIMGAPLAALLLEKKWMRLGATGLLAATGGLFFVFWIGHIARREQWTGNVIDKISRLQNDHSYIAKFEWKNEKPGEFRVVEDYSVGELYANFLKRIDQPQSFGFIGTYNSVCLSLFGSEYQNRVIPLVDCRDESKILPASIGRFEYVVAADKFADARDWADANGFEQIYSCSGPHGLLLLAFKKRGN